MKRRKTDYGTIILHWLLVAGFGVAFVSGMRIATEVPERTWINFFDAVLPQNVWVMHMQAAVVLVAVSLTYTIYVLRSGLGRRIRSGCRSNPPGAARCCPHRESVVKQMSDDPATEKTGSAENRDEPAMAGCAVCEVFCHGRQPA